MTFYVCTIAKRKNGKRHIAHKCKSEKEAIEVASHINREKYKIQICSGDWTYIYHMN
jgi:hypothetical protein